MFFRKTTGNMEYDFGFTIIILCTGVLKKGNRIHDEDVSLIKSFFERHFTAEFNSLLPKILKLSMSKSYPLLYVSFILRKYTNYQTRINICRLLLQLSASDSESGEIKSELTGIISAHLGILASDWQMLRKNIKIKTSDAYVTLEVSSDASHSEIKKAFRKMAMKHHPDKFHHLDKESQEEASKTFKKVRAAYEEIKRLRGI